MVSLIVKAFICFQFGSAACSEDDENDDDSDEEDESEEDDDQYDEELSEDGEKERFSIKTSFYIFLTQLCSLDYYRKSINGHFN